MEKEKLANPGLPRRTVIEPACTVCVCVCVCVCVSHNIS